jgi:hypothetical protein
VSDQTPPTNDLTEWLTRSMSPEGREILERVEALAPVSETDPADLGPAVALIESLPDKDRAAVYRLIELKARAYQHRGERYADEARIASQAVGLIDLALGLERAAGREPEGGMTLGEALEVLRARGEELADPDAAGLEAVPQGSGRTVPAFYPEFTDAERFRRWDGSEQAEAWARLTEARDAAILTSVGALVGTGIEGTDYARVIALLWNLDGDEAAEFVRRHRGGR